MMEYDLPAHYCDECGEYICDGDEPPMPCMYCVKAKKETQPDVQGEE